MSPVEAGIAELTGEQEEAVRRRSEPLLLSAGAGSGKTAVLVERFVAAVLQDGVAPARVLAITFTDRAAAELRDRVRERLLELGRREEARDTEAALVTTFHGFCARLLRAHALQAGLDPEFEVLDEGLAGRLRERAFAAALRGFLAGGGSAAVDLAAAYDVDGLSAITLGIHAELRSRGETHPRLPDAAARAGDDRDSRDAVASCALLDELLRSYGSAYESLKQARAAVDFDDLELLARDLLLRDDSVRGAWSERFELMMVDEFQDTNARQLAILTALERENLFTVGDELQAIYGFRHADVRIFRARRESLDARGASLALTGNFRSREAILDVVNAVFAERMEDAFQALVGRRDVPPTQEPRIELLLAARSGWEDQPEGEQLREGLPRATAWRAAEARMLAARVAELVQEGSARPGEIVVLLRAVGDIEVYDRALQMRGLRTLAMVGRFWGRLETVDLLAYLRALANPLDEQALYQALASPLAGVSADGLALLALASAGLGRGAFETAVALGRPGAETAAASELLAAMSPQDRDGLARFCELLASERVGAPGSSIATLLERVLDLTGYREHLLALEWGARRLANVHKLLRLARRFEAGEGRDLRAFLDHVEAIEASRTPEPEAPVEGVEPDAVRLMTVHAAKGLEFPVVCVADLARAPNRGLAPLLVDGERVGLSLKRLDGEKGVPTLDYQELSEERRTASAREEERIVYVAMTRARDRLLLSGALDPRHLTDKDANGNGNGGAVISWLAPALLTPQAEQMLGEGARHFDSEVAGGSVPARVRWRVVAPEDAAALLETAREKPSPVAPEHSRPSDGSAAGGGKGSAAAPTPPPGPRAGALSYSALSLLRRCAYRYYLERVVGLPEDHAAARREGAASGLDPRARGTLVHSLLEDLDATHPVAPDEGAVAARATALGIATDRAQRREVADLIRGALGADVLTRIARASDVRREHPFALALGLHEPLVVGVIDLLAYEADGGALVVDYKSDRVSSGQDLEALAAEEYEVQRLLYALAALRGGAPRVEVAHLFLEWPSEHVSATYEAGALGELETRVRGLIAAAEGGVYPVSESPHRGLCLTCPGRDGMCSWPQERTLAEPPGA